MLNKLYEKLKNIIKTEYKFLLFTLILFLIMVIRLPYYITTNGGLIDLENRIDIENKKEIKGSFNLAYVNEVHATIPYLIIAKLNPKWDIYKESELTIDNEKIEDVNLRNSIMLKEANDIAIKLAYQKANKSITIKDNKVYAIYIDKTAKTDLKVGDQIIKINDLEINSKEQLFDYIRSQSENTDLTFEVIRDGKKYRRKATTQKVEDQVMVGVMISNVSDLKTDPKIDLKFKNSESGSSGGLTTCLAIYSYLIDEDITKGRKIVGTGTIDINGNVGRIDGVKYKLSGAVRKKADIFFVPANENYKEALKEKKKYHYDIEIVPVNTLDEAINYLEK